MMMMMMTMMMMMMMMKTNTAKNIAEVFAIQLVVTLFPRMTQPLLTTMRSADTELQTTIELRATVSEIAAPKPDLDAKAEKRRFWSTF